MLSRAVHYAVLILAMAAGGGRAQPPAQEVPSADIVVTAPTCTNPDGFYRYSRAAARQAEDQEDFKAAAKRWEQALEASRCPGAADPSREIIALAGRGMAQIYTGAHYKSAVNLNAALAALLEEEQRTGRNALHDQNVEAVFALREALSAKVGRPFTLTGSRLVNGRLPETKNVNRRFDSSYSLLLRSAQGGGALCPATLMRWPVLIYPSVERGRDSVGAVVVRLDLDPKGAVLGASIVASAPVGNTFEQPEMERPESYVLRFSERGCTLPRDLLVSFRFRTRPAG